MGTGGNDHLGDWNRNDPSEERLGKTFLIWGGSWNGGYTPNNPNFNGMFHFLAIHFWGTRMTMWHLHWMHQSNKPQDTALVCWCFHWKCVKMLQIYPPWIFIWMKKHKKKVIVYMKTRWAKISLISHQIFRGCSMLFFSHWFFHGFSRCSMGFPYAFPQRQGPKCTLPPLKSTSSLTDKAKAVSQSPGFFHMGRPVDHGPRVTHG